MTMDSNQSPGITSFVIRFIHTKSMDQSRPNDYRGNIRHIQTNQEINFTHWTEAVSFIQKYVNLEGLRDHSSG